MRKKWLLLGLGLCLLVNLGVAESLKDTSIGFRSRWFVPYNVTVKVDPIAGHTFQKFSSNILVPNPGLLELSVQQKLPVSAPYLKRLDLLVGDDMGDILIGNAAFLGLRAYPFNENFFLGTTYYVPLADLGFNVSYRGDEMWDMEISIKKAVPFFGFNVGWVFDRDMLLDFEARTIVYKGTQKDTWSSMGSTVSYEQGFTLTFAEYVLSYGLLL